ncbi:MAG TPA: glycosyltransferase [Chitinivibrionales bacterium]
MNSKEFLISIVIVHFKVPDFLQRALRSLRQAQLYDRSEVIVVDNASQDGSKELILGEFSEVQWIGLKSNIGFGKACNVGAQCARGAYILFLNPDTLISKNTLTESVRFLKEHGDAGLMGPKILNSDGTLQVSCRRSFPTPSVAFYRLSGLSKLFPSSQRFGRYNLSFLDPDTVSEVDAVSGSFMFMPLTLFQGIGGFDETFFMYGEDLDLCYRVKQQGCTVWYNPHTQIVHFKGRSSAKMSLHSKKAFYEAMLIFSRKYKSVHKSFLPGWVIATAIAYFGILTIASTILKTFPAMLIDFFLINCILFTGITIRFSWGNLESPYLGPNIFTMIAMHVLLSVSFILIFVIRGVYSKERYSPANAVITGLIASAIFMSCIYFVSSMAVSRIAFLLSTICITLLLVLWREGLPRIMGRLQRLIYSTGRVIILGNDDIAASLIKNFEDDKTARIAGVMWPLNEKFPGQFMGYPVLGTIENIRAILERDHVDLLLIATVQPWYSHVIESLASSKIRNLTIRWVPHELFTKPQNQLPQVIPLHDFAV